MSLVKNLIDELIAEFPFLTIEDISNEMLENAFYCEIDGQWSTKVDGSLWCNCD
jgi:hypothetical protein